MAAEKNPFTPGFGQVPPFLAGRSYVVQNVVDAFENGPRDPNLTTIFTGARGTGKTTLLTLLADKGRERGWVTARVSAVPGMLEEILQQAMRSAGKLEDKHSGIRLTSIDVGPVSAAWEYRDGSAVQAVPTWRTRLETLLDELEGKGLGLIISVDELQADFDEMVQLASTYQHLVGERRRVSLLMAGLPYQVSRVLNDKSISFLRRASRCQLGRIADADIRTALAETVERGGKQIEPDALDAAVAAIGGFPFLMQLVGYRMWTQAEGDVIDIAAAQRGVERAREEMRSNILEVTYDELSEGDLSFVEAMLEDDGPSRISDIRERMGKSTGYVAQYRRRLLEEGVIGERGRGLVDFELPGWRDFARAKLGE